MKGLDLTKSQKKIALQIIETGLIREYEKGIKRVKKIIRKWEKENLEARETYMKMNSQIRKSWILL